MPVCLLKSWHWKCTLPVQTPGAMRPEGTKLGRSGAIDELLSHLVDYVGGGRVFTYDRKFSTVEDSLTGQADFALLMGPA